MITAASINNDSRNTGIVYFVGNAASCETTTIPIAAMAIPNNTKFRPAIMITYNARGVRKHP
jgi:hypothetical protein